MALTQLTNGMSGSDCRTNINAVITGLNNASVPKVIYVTTAGNDTTGDGTLAKPFLTAQQGFNAGQSAAQPFMLNLGIGSFSITNSAGSGYLKAVQGQSELLTSLQFNASAATVDNASGSTGGTIILGISDITCACYAAGGSVTITDENNYSGGNGGGIILLGHGRFEAYANGGSVSSSGSDQGGSGGDITLSGSLKLINGALGAAGGNAANSGADGTILADGCDLRGTTSITGYTTIGRCSITSGFTPNEDKGGNATYAV